MKKLHILTSIVLLVIVILFTLNTAMFSKVKSYQAEIVAINNSQNSEWLNKTTTGNQCPDAIGGSDGSLLQIKFFYSKFCPWCMKEEPILQELVSKYGRLIHIQWYNINTCPELVDQYDITGAPTFVFSTVDNQTEYSHYGFIAKKDLTTLICDVTGGCT